MATGTESADNRACVGNRVRLIGTHRFAGFTGIYIADRVFYQGEDPVPVVKLSYQGTEVETLVHDAKNQMRKLESGMRPTASKG